MKIQHGIETATALIQDKPLSFRALDDGGMVVISPSGQKFTFSADQVTAALSGQKTAPAPSSVAQPAPVKRSHHKKN